MLQVDTTYDPGTLCPDEAQPDCYLTMIDGVAYLRLGESCGLKHYLLGQERIVESGPRLNWTTRELTWAGRKVLLTRMEYHFLDLLLRADECLLSYEAIIGQIWGERPLPAARTSIRSLVNKLRIKLRAAQLPDHVIINVHGRGFRLDRSGV